MGDKIEAKKIAKNGLPIIEGSDGAIKSYDEAKTLCKEIGYPVLLKAAAGGGGKGMKIVEEKQNFKNFSLAKNEAKKYFGNDDIYIENI